MRLALNFQRVDPTRGGAETYVADLCRALVGAGHRVDLYAESWREGAVPEGVKCVPVAARGPDQAGAALELRPELGGGAPPGVVRLHGRADQHLAPRRDHSPGGRPSRQPRGQRRGGSRRAGHAQLYRLGKTANPKYWVHEAIERRQYDRGATGQGGRRQQPGQGASPPVPPRAPDPDPRDPQRHRPRAAHGRSSGRGPLRLPEQAGAGAGRPGRPVRRAQLRAQGAQAAPGGPGRAEAAPARRRGRSTCSSAAAATPGSHAG